MNAQSDAGRHPRRAAHHYCTLFDQNYLSRGLALYFSLRRHHPEAAITVLCLDELTRKALAALALPGVTLISLAELEGYDPHLHAVRSARLPAEYYFTCKSVLMRYILRHHPADRLTYLDSDLLCFSDPLTLFDAFPAATVMLTPHRFPDYLKDREQYGLFNAGWVSTTSDAEGLRFVEWWRDLCLEYCELKVFGEKFADQKYLNQVTGAFPHAVAVPHHGVNIGPWNLAVTRVESSGSRVLVDGDPLIFFHFHGVRHIVGNLYDTGLHEYRVDLKSPLRLAIYEPYMNALRGAEETLQMLPGGTWRKPETAPRRVGSGLMGRLRYVKKIGGVLLSRTTISG